MYAILYTEGDPLGDEVQVHNQLRQVRITRGLTQQELAQRVQVTRQTIIAVEQGRYQPSVKLALQLAAALESPITELFWLA